MRRIEAVTSGEAWALLDARSREADELRAEIESLRKEAKKRPAAAAAATEAPDASVRVENGVNVIVQSVDGFDADALLDLSDRSSSGTHRPRSSSARGRTGRSTSSRTSTKAWPSA